MERSTWASEFVSISRNTDSWAAALETRSTKIVGSLVDRSILENPVSLRSRGMGIDGGSLRETSNRYSVQLPFKNMLSSLDHRCARSLRVWVPGDKFPMFVSKERSCSTGTVAIDCSSGPLAICTEKSESGESALGFMPVPLRSIRRPCKSPGGLWVISVTIQGRIGVFGMVNSRVSQEPRGSCVVPSTSLARRVRGPGIRANAGSKVRGSNSTLR